MFVNREAELEMLNARYASGRAEFFVLYGRRRVGKTELLTEFCRDKRHVFFVADLDTEQVLRAGFSAAVNAVLLGERAASAVYPRWEDIFSVIGEHARAKRLVVVLDEFPYLAAAHTPLASTLQRMWDRTLKNTQLMLILCGSSIGMMENTVLGYKAPLYGRRTAQFLLEPLTFSDAKLFFPNYPPEDQVRAYAVIGGAPAYLQAIDPRRPLREVIREEILLRGAFLYDEVRFLLQQELREPRNYFAVLEAIAAGRTRLNEIKQATGLEGASAYLDTLQSLRMVERVAPVTEKQPHKSRRGLYRLRDPYFRFWFRFIHPRRTALEQGANSAVFESEVWPQIDSFTALVFEEISRQFLWRQGLAGALPFAPNKIGGWWRGGEEVGVLALGAESALLVECKWTKRAVGVNILNDLERKAELLRRDMDAARIYLGLCARSGFTEALYKVAADRADVLLFDLEQILGGGKN